MGTNYRWRKVEPSRDLCGASKEEFARLMDQLADSWKRNRAQELASRPNRQRASGAGRKQTPMWVQLLATMTMWRQNLTTRATGRLFEVHERTIRRWRDRVEAVLLDHGFQPPGVATAIRSVEDLGAYVAEVLPDQIAVDGTDVARSSPGDYQEQRAAFSGKTKTHVVKATVVAGRERRPLWFEANPCGEGRTHDITMLRSQPEVLATLGLVAAAGVLVMADKAYQTLPDVLGINVMVGVRKPKGEPRSIGNRLYNRVLSSMRMPVEHAIGRLKWWQVMRYWRRAPHRFATSGRAIAILASLI